MNLLERAGQYANGIQILRDWLGSGGIAVEPSRSQGRANICLACPCNDAGFSVAESVATAIRNHVELKNKLELRVDGEKSLHTCQICQCALRLKVHVPMAVIRGHMTPDELGKFPDHCWQKKEI